MNKQMFSDQTTFTLNRAVGFIRDGMDILSQSIMYTGKLSELEQRRFSNKLDVTLNTARLLIRQIESLKAIRKGT